MSIILASAILDFFFSAILDFSGVAQYSGSKDQFVVKSRFYWSHEPPGNKD